MKEILEYTGKLSTELTIINLAEKFSMNSAVAHAIVAVESSGKGFYDNTLIPVVRLENHQFSKYSKKKFDKSHPNLSSSVITNAYNKKGIAEFIRFNEAFKLDEEAAIKATSWGMGQIMGFNHEICDVSLRTFISNMFESEYKQLEMMFMFLKNHNKKLINIANKLDWNTFALYYNGKDYAKLKYHIKLEKAYNDYVQRNRL